jgi:hypothetical protein
MRRSRVGSSPHHWTATVRIQPGVALYGNWLFRSKCRDERALSAVATGESEILLADNLYWNLARGRVNSELQSCSMPNIHSLAFVY